MASSQPSSTSCGSHASTPPLLSPRHASSERYDKPVWRRSDSPQTLRSQPSEQSSPYLTPPALHLEPFERPYKPDPEDDISLKQTEVKKKARQHGRHSRRHRENHGPQQRPKFDRAPTYRSIKASMHSEGPSSSSRSGEGYIRESAASESLPSANEDDSWFGSTDFEVGSHSVKYEPPTQFRQSVRERASSKVSMSSGNLISAVVHRDSRRQTLVSGKVRPMPSLLTATASSPSEQEQILRRSRASTISTISALPPDHSSTRRNRAFRDGGRRKPNMPEHGKGKGMSKGTPATITLRKASRALRSDDIRSLDMQLISQQATSSCSLRDGESHAKDIRTRSTSFSRFLNDLSDGCYWTLVDQSTFESDLPGYADPSANQALQNRRSSLATTKAGHGVIAGLALTLANAHVASYRNLKAEDFQRASLPIAEDGERRRSVQFSGRPSVHEIIWKPETTPTSSSSSTASSQATVSVEKSRKSSGSQASAISQSSTRCTDSGRDEEIQEHSATIQDSDMPEEAEGQQLAEWSWDQYPQSDLPSTPPENDNPRVTDNLGIASSSGFKSGHNRRNRTPLKLSKKWRSVPVNPGVESFPPLVARKTTSEWRQSAPVNIFDPPSGSEARPQASALEATLDHSVAESPPTPSQRGSLSEASSRRSPIDEAKKAGIVGSRIGVSSHVKRQSTSHWYRPHSDGDLCSPRALRNEYKPLSSDDSIIPGIERNNATDDISETGSRRRSILLELPKRFSLGRRSMVRESSQVESPIEPIMPAWRRASQDQKSDSVLMPHAGSRLVEVAGEVIDS